MKNITLLIKLLFGSANAVAVSEFRRKIHMLKILREKVFHQFGMIYSKLTSDDILTTHSLQQIAMTERNQLYLSLSSLPSYSFLLSLQNLTKNIWIVVSPYASCLDTYQGLLDFLLFIQCFEYNLKCQFHHCPKTAVT